MKILFKILKWMCITVFTLSACLLAWWSYDGKTQESALRAINEPVQGVRVDTSQKDIIAFMPEGGTDTAVIFYPGGGVPGQAYGEIAEQLAINDYACIIVNMPCNLAPLNPDAADSVMKDFPSISHWYIAGHSLGGHFAQRYAFYHQEQLDALISMGAVIRFDFSNSSLPVLSITASNDNLCNVRRLNSYSVVSPRIYTHHVIHGGCHRYFGSYSFQAGDGTPTITQQKQQSEIVQQILKFIQKKRKPSA